MRVLVVEDEQHLNAVIVDHLQRQGHVVDSCADGEAGLYYLKNADYDVSVVDILMPKLNGLELVKRLRASGNNTPVVFLTAKDTIADRVKGLDVGGSDYLVKPFAFPELMARLRAAARKSNGTQSSVFECADLRIDTVAHRVSRGGDLIELAPKEYAVLEVLIRNQGIVCSREYIESHVWSFNSSSSSNVVDVYIRALRKKLDDGREPKLIHTVRGSGYVMREQS